MSNNLQDSFFQRETLVLDFWKKNEIFLKSVEKEAPRGDYNFYDGPPFATGTPHYGHLVGQILKDLVPRFFTMKGYRVERKWGWDCHGLPIENIVEKELGTKTKKEIEELGVDRFNQLCRARVLDYAQNWYQMSDILGRFVDKDNAYHTMDLDFMESVWWVFKSLFDKGLIYKDYRSMHVCPRCETTLSQSEVSEGYQDIKDLSCIAKFPLEEEKNTFVLAWTTTPWTLIANTALAVGEDIDYIKVLVNNKAGEEEKYILAKERAEDILKGWDYKIEAEFKGKDLVGKKYQALFNYYQDNLELENRDNSWKIYSADFVNTEEGSGIVHIAPAFGQDDMELGKEKNLAFVQHVELNGYFKKEVTDFPGLNVKPLGDHMATDIEIIRYLAQKSWLFSKEKYEHSYPHCWRCDTPLINYATSSWFVSVLKIKDKLLEEAKKINWSPNYIKDGRFGKWLEGARDWSISRQRFWATPLPIWECPEGHRMVLGSVAELEDLSKEKVSDIHKDVVDKLKWDCPECSKTMTRSPDVLDCWFESGSMPYAQLHYPFENKEKFKNLFPAEFIAEGIDQTRAWFYYLHVIAVALFGLNPFKNVIVNGMVLAEDGKKMSKKLKNYPEPEEMIKKYGADAFRMYILSSPVVTAENFSFSEKGLLDSLRKNVILINNIYNFYQSYEADLSSENFKDYEKSTNVLDLWILKKLSLLIAEVDKEMLAYNPIKAARSITSFVDELSTWYLRRSRDRLKGEDKNDKILALSTLRFTLLSLSQVIAPFMPFIAEDLWQKINNYNLEDVNKSIHLESWPSFNLDGQTDLLEKMTTVRQVVELGLAKRDEEQIKVRQVLQSATIKGLSSEAMEEDYQVLIKEELNVKELKFLEEAGDLSVELDTEISPTLRREGLRRDLIRLINMRRKEQGLSINDRANVFIHSLDPSLPELLEIEGGIIQKETLSENISLLENWEEAGKELKLGTEKIVLIVEKID